MLGPWGPRVDIGFFWGSQGGGIGTCSLQTRRSNWTSLGPRGLFGFEGTLFSLGMACHPKHHYPKSVEGYGIGWNGRVFRDVINFETGGRPQIMHVRSRGPPVAPHVVPHVFGYW